MRFLLLAYVTLLAHSFKYIPHTKLLSWTSRSSIKMSTVECQPGSPIVKKVDSENFVAYMTIALGPESTQRAFNEACELFNEEVKQKGYKVAGFRPGAKLPPAFLYQMFGEDQVKLFCATLLSEDIQDECEKTGLRFVGRGRITQFNEMGYTPGKAHVIDVECDIVPDIEYLGGYKGLKATAVKSDIDVEKFEKVKKNIRERYKILTPTDASYVAKMGDSVLGNMKGYELNDDGSRGKPLSQASGDKLEISLEAGKFMPGMVEGLVGAKAGDVRAINIQFPTRPSGPGAALSGKKAVFDVEIVEVKTQALPEWDATLAERVRPGLTFDELEKEVRDAVEGEQDSQTENIRNDALAKSLLEIVKVKKLPESLMEETTMQKFQSMLGDFKEQGSTEEQLREMATPENYDKYKNIVKGQVEKSVTLSLVFRDIREKENLNVTTEEIKQQVDIMMAQAKQKKEQIPDIKRLSEEIENTLLGKKVFDFLASHADITWIDAPPAETEAQAPPPATAQ